MKSSKEMELWAMDRAQKIVLREGLNLVKSAKGADSRITLENSFELRRVISAALMEAPALAAN